MKNFISFLVLFLICNITYGQISIGPKVGVNSSKIILDDDMVGVGDGSRKVGFHAGLFGRFQFGAVYAQPELLYTSSRGEINIDAFGISQIQEYRFDQIDLPIMVGLKIGPLLRAFAGPVGRFLINADGNEGSLAGGVMRNYKDVTFGYQLGVGIDIGNLMLDLKYENNLSRFGDGVNIGSQRFAVDQRQEQIILSLGIIAF